MAAKLRDTFRADAGGLHSSEVDADELVDRIGRAERFLRAVDGRIPEEELAATRTVISRAGERIPLSRDHTVIAIAGPTGSGKSSLFNSLARLELSRVGRRRPTTAVAYACVWHPDGADDLLDWLEIPFGHRIARESALDGEDEAGLRGLVLLDLPDFDSVEAAHAEVADRLTALADLIVWVLDPQKYADRVIHERYLRRLVEHRDSMVVVLNQVDTLPSETDLKACLTDLRRLLDEDGLGGVELLGVSVTAGHGMPELRGLLEKTVTARHAYLGRLSNDLAAATAGLAHLVGAEAAEDVVDRVTVRAVADAMSTSTGVPSLAEAAARSYRRGALRATGWLPASLVTRLRRQRAEAPTGDADAESAAMAAFAGPDETPVSTALPAPPPVQRSALSLAVRTVADRASDGLPELWRAAMHGAARSKLDELPEALDAAVAAVDPHAAGKPAWWRVSTVAQWLLLLTSVGGLGWLLAGYVLRDAPAVPRLGNVPVPALLLLGGLLGGWLLALLLRPVIAAGARRRRAAVESTLRAGITEVVREKVVAPVREELRAYADARAAFHALMG